MNWTPIAPTVEGWYWVIEPRVNGEVPSIVEVKLGTSVDALQGERTLWYGPLVMPAAYIASPCTRFDLPPTTTEGKS